MCLQTVLVHGTCVLSIGDNQCYERYVHNTFNAVFIFFDRNFFFVFLKASSTTSTDNAYVSVFHEPHRCQLSVSIQSERIPPRYFLNESCRVRVRLQAYYFGKNLDEFQKKFLEESHDKFLEEIQDCY